MPPIETRHHRTAEDSLNPSEYVVVFLDALGFRRRVRATDLSDLVSQYADLIKDVAWSKHTPIFRLPAGGVDRWDTRAVILSDSILLWSDTRAEAVDMLLTSAGRILGRAAEMDWPLRGIVTAGPCVLDETKGVFIGEALVRAVELEKGQSWIGCGIDHRALDHPVAGRTVRTHVDVVWYHVPMKRCWPQLRAALWWKDYAPDGENRLRNMSKGVRHRERLKYEAALAFIGSEPRRIATSPSPSFQIGERSWLSKQACRLFRRLSLAGEFAD